MNVTFRWLRNHSQAMGTPPDEVRVAVFEHWPLEGREREIGSGQRLIELTHHDAEEIPPDWHPRGSMRFRYTGIVDEQGRAVFRLFHWVDVELDEDVELPLSDDERTLLRQGLSQLGGPSRPTDELARVIGFDDRETMHADKRRIMDLLRAGQPLTKLDWQRALIATEIVWAGNFYGAAHDWEAVTGWTDERTLQVLRELQLWFLGLRPPRRQGKKPASR
jgi:hypothetical protein